MSDTNGSLAIHFRNLYRLEKTTVTQQAEKFPVFVKPKVTSPCSGGRHLEAAEFI